MRTILKVIFSALVAAGAIVIWLVVLFIPQLESISFGLGIIFSMAIYNFIEGLEEMDGGRREKGRDV